MPDQFEIVSKLSGVAGPIGVSSGSDDAEENLSGRVNLSSSDLELADESSANPGQTIGMRFAGVDIPQGATIVAAYIQFQADELSTGPVSLEITGQAADDAQTFSSANGNVSTRPVTTAWVAWSPPDWNSVGVAGPDQRTPDLSEIIQEIVDRTDWSPGNAMVIVITGSGRRTAESYNGSPAGAPLLHFEYIPQPGG